MSGIVFKKDNNKAFSFISLYGLHECGVEKNGDIYITLLRSFSKTQFTNGEPDGQMHGSYKYDYLLMSTLANIDFSELQRRQDIMAVGERSITYSSDEIIEHESAFKISGDGIVYRTMTPGDNCSYLRFYNDSDKPAVAKITFPNKTTQIQQIDFDNNPIGLPLSFTNSVEIKTKPWEIYTFMIK